MPETGQVRQQLTSHASWVVTVSGPRSGLWIAGRVVQVTSGHYVGEVIPRSIGLWSPLRLGRSDLPSTCQTADGRCQVRFEEIGHDLVQLDLVADGAPVEFYFQRLGFTWCEAVIVVGALPEAPGPSMARSQGLGDGPSRSRGRLP